MTSVEKRRSRRKSGGHRKHSDGGYSDTSSSGSFLDETDREVSNLTDRAFRSLCIGDEAVYNDSDLCSSSPCSQRDKQLAFGQNREDREREELKRAAHESFRLRVQQYEQDWVHGGMSGAEICRDPHWETHGEMTQGRVSATFQHSFVESAQREQSLREEQLSFLSNGATDLSSQQRRSRSRVSSLIRTFNSDSQGDGAWTDSKVRERYNGNSWDTTALMSIQRELSEFSNSYQQNFTRDNFPTADPFFSRNANLYSAAVSHVNSAPSFTSASHSMFNCNSNFFIHSEFSPFKVWTDHNRFPFQQEQVSGFSHHSEIPKWYETPMYKELSQEAQPQGSYRFKERGVGYSRNNLLPVVPPSPPRSTSMVLQKALAVEKRCESELMGQYTHRKRTQSLGTKRLPTQRPSTASPTTEMSRRVQETISSVKALQQKIKKMTAQNMDTGMTANQQGALCSEDDLISYGHNALTWAPNVVRSNTTPLNINQLLTPSGRMRQEAAATVQQCAASPQPVEHPPVRAESRGATPDIRMSSYRSRATSLLFNLKDNRKRVKNTYSPTKFKNSEMPEKSKHPSAQEPRDTVIDIPDFPDPDIQFTHAASHQYVQQYQNPGLSFAAQNPCPRTAHAGQYSEYQTAEKQAEMFCHSTFTGVTPENYTATQLANGQNPHEDLLSLPSYQYGTTDNVESLRGGVYGLNASYTAADTQKHTANNQTGDYFRSNANAEQYFNETVEREFTKVERYQQPKDNKHDYSNVFSQERWRNEQDAEKLISPWKQEITALIERDQHSLAYQRAAIIKEEHNLTRDKYRGNNLNLNKEVDKLDFEQSFVMGTSHKSPGYINPNISKQPQCPPIMNHDAVENRTYYGQQQQQQQPGTIRDKHVLQKYYGNNDNKETNQDNSLTQNSNRHTDQDYRNQHALYSNKDKTMFVEETGQRKQHMPVPEGHKMQCLQQIQATPQFEHNVQKNPLSTFENAAAPSTAAPAKDRQFSEVKAAQATTEQHTQAELAKAQHQAQVEQPNAESARLILAGQTGSEEVKAEQARAEPSECERVKPTQAEPFKDKTRNKEQTEKSKEKHLEQARKDETKVKQTREQEGTEKPRDITEEAGATHMKNEQGEQVNAEQAEVDKLKEEHIKTELEQTEQAGILTARANVQKVEEKQVRVEQIEIEQKNAKQIETENIKAEQVENEQRKYDKANHELMKEQKAKTEQLKMKEDEKVKVDQIKLEDVRAKPKEDSNQAGPVNTEQPTTQLRTTREAKTEAQTNVVAKPELPKTVDLYEKFVKPGSNIKATQQVKGQPDRVEQVKTELAKAKAELAKIKEKMRGEQKGKVKTTVVTDDITKKDDPLKLNENKSEDFKKKDQETQSDQKKRDSLVNKYDDVREKQDFTNAVSTNGNKSASGDDIETSTLSLSGDETVTNNKSNDKNSPKSGLATTNTENKEEVIGFKGNDLSEGHYVYSESSKEFKLLSSSYSPTNVDNKGNRDTVTDKENDGDVEKLEKCEAAKHTDISQPRSSDSRKHDPLERKHKSTDHSSVSAKDLHFTPPRALSQKERAQAKQEILTSKIKAHAEKEISAIKEKGLRDGLLSKNSNKQLAGSQSISIRQRPPIQEVSKKHESTASSNNTPKHQIEPAGIQSVSPASSAATPVMSALTTAQLVDSSQKQVPKEPVKSNDNVLVSTTNTKQTGCSTTITNLAENQVKKNQSGVKSPVQSKEQAINDNQAKQEPKHDANSGKQKEERLKDDSAINSDHRNKKKNDSAQATALVKVPTTENPEIKHEAVPEDSAPTLNLILQDQNTTAMVDDSLQIMGIMVIVRERKPPETNGERDNSAQESMNTKKKGGSNSKLSQLSRENESSANGNTAKTSNRAVQEMCPTEKEDQAKMNPPEIVPETLSERKNKESEQKANLQESSSVNTKYQRETQLQKPMIEKSAPAIVTAPAKNKVLAETQPLPSKQGIIEGSTNDPSDKIPKENSAKSTMKEEEAINPGKTQTAHDAFMANVDHTGTDFKMNSGRTDAESLKDDVHLSSAKDMTTSINPSKSWNIDGKSAPLLDEKRQDSTQLRPFNEGPSPSQSLNDNQNSVTPKLQHKETFTEKKNQVDDVHIDSIAIRVVPSVTQEDKQDIAGKLCVTVVPSDAVKATELHEVAPPRREERANTSNNDHRIKDLAPANSDRQVEDKLGVQHVLASVRKLSDSLKNSKQPSNTNGTQTGNGKPEKVKEREEPVVESKLKATEGDYFQVQGAEETNDEPHANDGETLDGASKGGGLPGSLPNKTPVSNKPYKELQYEAFVLDPSIKKTLESSQIKVQDENMEKKNWETEDKLASKQTDTVTERQNSSEKMNNGKQHTVSQSSLSARESQGSRTSDQTRNNAVSEKPGVKPKLKSSTIPDISAIADYARLKVIVSEEQESTIQEFPPKKEGFFPLIQSRHSRRPVFTLDPKEFPVKEKKMPTKTEMSAKVNKEPKALVFPITEKEHQRTGMFKLGDKEKQEKMVSETQSISDAGAKHTHCLKERMKSPTTLSKTQGCEEQQVRTDAQRQVDQSHLQTIFSSAADNRPRNTSASQHLMSPVNFNAGEKHEEHKDDSRTPRNAEPFDDKLVKRREERKEKPSQEGFATQHDKTTANEEASYLEKEKWAEEIMKKRIIEESRASLAEEERRSAQREEERRAKEREAIALRIKERREKQRESDKRAEEDRRAKQMKEHRAAPKEEETRAKLRKVRETERTKTEEDRRAKLRREEEQLKENEKKRLKQREERAALEEQQRRAALEKQRLAVQAEQQRRSAQEEQQRRSAQEEQQRRSAQEEQQRRSAQEQQRRSAQEEQQRRSAQEEQQRRSAQEEQQRRSAQEEQQRRSAQEEQQRSVQAEQQRRSAQEEQQRSVQEEQQRRSAREEQQRRSAQEEQQQRAAQEDQRRRTAQEEQQRRAEREEQQRRSAQEEQQRRAVHEEQQQRRAAQEKQQQRAAQEEQQKRSAHEEQQRQALQEEHQRRAELEKQKLVAHEEQQRRAAQEEQQRRAAHEEQQRRTAQEEEQRTAAQEELQRRAELEKQKIAAQEDQQKRSAHEEQQRRAARRDAQQELQIRAAQEEEQKRDALIEEQKQIDQTKEKILSEIWEERKRAQGGEEDRKAVGKEKTAAKQKVEKQAKEERSVQLEDIKAEGESQVARERLTQREDEIKATTSEEDEKFAALRKTERATEVEEQRKAAQMTDALQYYAINSTESERKTKERPVCSPFPSQQKHNPPECESTEDSGTYTRHYRTHGSASPAPRSNTSSPALGAKPSMFRVKDNTIRGSSFIKPVKPRFHKNFGEDFRVGSPIERVSERGEEEQEVIRHGADSRSNRLAVIKEFSSSQPASSSQDYSAYRPQHRPYSRRSIALDEDDSRSVISNMSEGVESFATSATDLADVRSLYDYERPESACSFSSDMSRSMGKPPTVPPKSDKAMQRAKRLTTRRINKELCKAKEDKHEKPPQEVSRVPPSSSNEVHYSNRHVVASPHFSSPISLAHAPVSMPTSHTEHPSSHHPVQASPNATGASSLPIASPHVTASVTLPVASSNPTSPVSNNAVLQTVPHVSSSPTLHHATHPAPVTQYHVESSYPQSYPFTQRKVLQDLGSGQYFVVDVPVQVKTKTFFDPETGKYVQLNVRESGQSNSRPQAQQTYQQPQLQSQMRVKSQHPHSQASPAGKPIMLYQGYHGYPQGYQHAAINSAPPNGSSTPLSLHQNQQPVRDNHSYGCPTSEVRENTEGHCYSPEKTPYMDTVNDTEKTYNTLYNTHGSYEAFPECDTNSQLAGSSVCENDNSAHTRYQPRDIITMGELEDFMEASDW